MLHPTPKAQATYAALHADCAALGTRLEAMHAAYWAVCDAEGQAIDPAGT
jgi:hypothetical protein